MNAVEVTGLRKKFGRAVALDGLDLTVLTGEVHGFLGPNGAGKSTTLRILLGLVRADEGRVRLLGGDPWRDAVELHRRVAYVPGDVSLWPGLTGGEILDLLDRLRGTANPRRRADLVERFELDLGTRARAYSKGNRQKVALVAALSSSAELLVLDEPTAGLDPLMEARFRSCIGETTDGRTVLLSSHILSEVEALCDRVTIIRDGRTIDSGSLADLRRNTETTITVETASPVGGLSRIPGIRGVVVSGRRVRFTVATSALDTVMRVLADHGVRSLTSSPPTLEDMFLEHYASPGGESATTGGRR